MDKTEQVKRLVKRVLENVQTLKDRPSSVVAMKCLERDAERLAREVQEKLKLGYAW